jgi:predicted peroxiredoxin
MKNIIRILSILFFSVNLMASNQAKQLPLTGKKLVVVVSSGENEKGGMGITLGLSAAKKGADVTIVLGAKALKFALKKSKQEIFQAKQLTHREILKKSLEKGAKVYVCHMCAKALNLTRKDFIEGTQIVKSLKIFNAIYDNAQVLSF